MLEYRLVYGEKGNEQGHISPVFLAITALLSFRFRIREQYNFNCWARVEFREQGQDDTCWRPDEYENKSD